MYLLYLYVYQDIPQYIVRVDLLELQLCTLYYILVYVHSTLYVYMYVYICT